MIAVKTKSGVTLEKYKGIIDDALFDELNALAEKLRGIRVCHINATSYGGGVAEILHKEIPLAKGLDLDFDWKILSAESDFFDVTKKIHNGLQGADLEISEKEWHAYGACNLRMSKLLNVSDYDVIFVHDPQPAEIIDCLGKNHAKWVWRCHIDTSEPNKKIADYFLKFLYKYDASIFTMPSYIFKGLKSETFIIPPAIDPLAQKNEPMEMGEARQIVSRFGIDLSRPLVTQVSRFDPWKDPKGVVDAYKIASNEMPGLQLALVG